MEPQFTYSGDPASSDLEAVRFYCQDTDESDPFLDDAEITYLLTVEGSVQRAAVQAARRIALKLAQSADIKTGVVTITNKERAKSYSQLADQLESHVIWIAKPYAGGISIADKRSQELDADRVPPAFTRDTRTIYNASENTDSD